MPESVDTALVERLNTIFFPHFWEKRLSLRDSDRKLVHYTSAENALRIFTEKAIMMRSTVCMNDYSEVQHGHRIVQKCFLENDSSLHRRFSAAVDNVYPNAAKDAFDTYDAHFNSNVFRTYVACISEHHADEDDTGRLSMWRAYNKGASGVALLLNKAPLLSNAAFLGIFASPVAYLKEAEVTRFIERIIQSIVDERDFLRTLSRENIVNSIFVLLMFSAICIKHHGFEEEREWRIIHLPGLFPSPHVELSSVTIAGLPQLVYKLPLANIPEKSFVGIDIPNFIEGLIIGPTQYPYPISEVLTDALSNAGMQDANQKIRISNIPLRT